MQPLSRTLRRIAASASIVLCLPALASVDFVGNLSPAPDRSTARAVASGATLPVSVEVFKTGVTPGAGAGAGIACTLLYGRVGAARSALPMSYSGDVGNNDVYSATLPTAGLGAGNHDVTAACSDDGGISQTANLDGPTYLSMTPPPTPPPGNALVQLFEWKWTDVAQECAWLAERGYTGVQVSSPAEHQSHLTVGGNPWFVRYRPVSYLLESRSGSAAQFADMVAACDAAGVDVIVDVVINHMTNAGAGALGIGGTFYFGNSYNFPGSYTPADFHYCGTDPDGAQIHDLFDFADRFQVHNCELFGLADIDTGAPGPRATLTAYLQNLIDLGVDGFRIDAAKHIASSDIEAILAPLTGSPYVVQEVPDAASEDVRFFEYLVNGDVTEFDYGATVGSAFLGCGSNPASLAGLGPGLYASDDALVFTDNHDTQRQGGCIVTFEDGELYDLANVFMLAYPYGYPRVMSSYHFATEAAGPPSTGGVPRDVWVDGEASGCNEAEWVCEHRRPALANTAKLRLLAGDAPLTDWWDDGNQRIAFGRGDRGYVAINAAQNAVNRTWSTSMAAGTYCNLARYEAVGDPAVCRYPGSDFPAPTSELVEVDGAGNISGYTLVARSALTIHAQGQVVIADGDLDGVPDDLDNCSALANADQRDTDGDGFGNACDADLNNDGSINSLDLGALRQAFFSAPGSGNWNADADFNGDDAVNSADLGILRAAFFGAPGPGALVPPQAPACGAPDTGLDPAEAFGDVMFLRGSAVGDWGAVPGINDFTNLGDGLYLLEVPLASGDFAYKVANGGWSIERSNIVDTLTDGATLPLQDNGGGSPNGALNVPTTGCYAFTLDASDSDFPQITMQRKF